MWRNVGGRQATASVLRENSKTYFLRIRCRTAHGHAVRRPLSASAEFEMLWSIDVRSLVPVIVSDYVPIKVGRPVLLLIFATQQTSSRRSVSAAGRSRRAAPFVDCISRGQLLFMHVWYLIRYLILFPSHVISFSASHFASCMLNSFAVLYASYDKNLGHLFRAWPCRNYIIKPLIGCHVLLFLLGFPHM